MSVTITDARAKLTAVLAPQVEGEPPVHGPADAIEPPCMLVGWRTPMVDGWGVCNAFGFLVVMLVAGRLEAEPGVEAIEAMYDGAQRRLRDDPDDWTIISDGGIGPQAIGGVNYLACRLEVRVPLAV
jgi:hypothetical protein